MDIYNAVVEYVEDMDLFVSWPYMLEIFKGAADKHPHGWDILVPACTAVGGTVEQAVPGVAALGCLQIAILIIDDLLDEDPRGVHHQIGPALAANLASTFQSDGLRIITGLDLPADTRLGILRIFNEMMGRIAVGQKMDAESPNTEEAYWQLVQAKSSPYGEAGLEAGALLGGASLELAKEIGHIGWLYGELLQIHDDLKDTLEVPATPDWLLNRATLPILFAQIVDHPDRERFLAIKPQVEDPQLLKEAQTILIRCGAISYCLEELQKRHSAARIYLDGLDLADPSGLIQLLDEMIQPARSMLELLDPEADVEEILAAID